MRRKPNKRKTRKKNSSTVSIANLESSLGLKPLGTKEDPPLDTPCRIHIHSKRKRLTDADGVSGKAAIDSLVLAGLLEDDGPTFVTEVSYSQSKCDKDSHEETIIEVYQQRSK